MDTKPQTEDNDLSLVWSRSWAKKSYHICPHLQGP